MKWVIRLYSLVLLGYTAWRTIDFLLSQLPKNDISLWLSLAFLFASEVGLLLWHEISLNHSTTREQQYLATGLTWLDFVGSLAAGVADMILRQTMLADYQIPVFLAQALIYGLPLIMALNVGGVLVYLSNDAEAQEDRAKRQLRFEITREALRELRDNQGQIAASMKKSIYSQLRDDVTGKLEKQYLASQAEKPKEQPTARRLSLPFMRPPTPNGHQVNYNAETGRAPEPEAPRTTREPRDRE